MSWWRVRTSIWFQSAWGAIGYAGVWGLANWRLWCVRPAKKRHLGCFRLPLACPRWVSWPQLQLLANILVAVLANADYVIIRAPIRSVSRQSHS